MENEKAIESYQIILRILEGAKFVASSYEKIDYGLQFSVGISGLWSGTIRIYENKKGRVKIDFSQLKGDYGSELIRLIETGLKPKNAGRRIKKTICCQACFHLTTGSCDGLLDKSDHCEYWFSPGALVIGTSYFKEELRHARARIEARGHIEIAQKRKKKKHTEQNNVRMQTQVG